MSLLKLRSLFVFQSSHKTNFLMQGSSACALATRGPKKKKGGNKAAELPDNLDIVNIFKGGKDAPIYPSDMYPPFVMNLLQETYTPDEIMLQIYRGERMPSAEEQWTLSNAIFRQRIKDHNYMHKWNLEYDSDEDMGEDLGGDPDVVDLDQEAEGELEEGEGGDD